MEGRIVKALSGFYYVETDSGIVECRARGRFRRDGINPLVGDLVRITVQGSKGVLEELLPRKNWFLRPAIANLELLVVFASAVIPVTEPFLIDRICAIAADRQVPVVLCVNKCDVDAGAALGGIYEKAGYPVVYTSAETGAGVDRLYDLLAGKLAAFTGNSGVGKSSILNRMDARLHIPVGEVSEKLGRGRHTTRHVELYRLPNGGIIADTPGFSSFDTERMELVRKEKLQYAFPELAPYLGKCRFPDCVHGEEPGCAVRDGAERGEIPKTRYESYLRLLESVRSIHPWEWKEE